ncbi:MAG: SelB C-terminal domain-containing protein, partial [Candidatus Aminicenantes bacterium]|nr:SelB C-terminal domain-containing protein [Candidatus Aminicenantes bacterium]
LVYNKCMKFNSYFVELDHHEPSFTGNLLIDDKPFPVNFKKIEDHLFIAFFKKQIQLLYQEKISFKNKKKHILILLPVLSKYNRRKLNKISHIIKKTNDMSERDIILGLLSIEKFLKLERLLKFFSLEKQKIIDFLIEMELAKKIKIIDFNSLYIISYDHFQSYLKELKSLFQYLYENRINTIKFSEIESKIKISQSSIFFKYLLSSFDNTFSFKILKDKILLQKVSLSEKEKKIIQVIESILKRNKLTVFSIENILKLGQLKYNEVNDSLWYLVEEGKLIQLNSNCFMFSTDFTKILNRLKKYKRNQGETIDIQSFRELTFFNRKSIIILLEYLDSQNITQRIGNKRKILVAV